MERSAIREVRSHAIPVFRYAAYGLRAFSRLVRIAHLMIFPKLELEKDRMWVDRFLA